MTGLSTPWSRALGLSVPIVNAPMGGAAGAALAAAVSRAGGLGMVGMGSAGTVDLLDAQLRELDTSGRPFGIGLVHWVVADQPQLLATALAARPTLLSVSFGEWSWIRRAHDVGVMAAAQVSDLRTARRAVEAGADVVIARGAEAGGHGTPAVGTLPLLAEILDDVSVPVLAAGGISSGRALAAVLAAGASGAWIGTALAACTESLTPEPARRVMLEAADTDTVLTRDHDIAHGYAWPPEFPERVIVVRNDAEAGVNAGQGVGHLRAVRSAADVISDFTAEAGTLLQRWC